MKGVKDKMLSCKVNLRTLDDNNLQCGACRKCAGKSILNYPFARDLRNSEDLVRELQDYITRNTGYTCKPTEIDKNPDINVYRDASCQELLCRIEAKYLEGQAFMKSKDYLGLHAKETLVVDEPKLKSYIQCKADDRKNGKEIPIYVVWKFDRPCDDVGGIAVFQEIDELERLYKSHGEKRAFRRRQGENDCQNGRNMGIKDKYHFSIRECEPIENLIPIIRTL